MNAYPDTRWVGLRFTFEFVDQEARQDAIPVSSGEAASSHIRDTLDNTMTQSAAYIHLEHNRWGLGRDFHEWLKEDCEDSVEHIISVIRICIANR